MIENTESDLMDHQGMHKIAVADKKRMAAAVYSCFGINGMLSVSVGALLPYLMDFKGISYEQGGMIISAYAVGNLLSNMAYGYSAQRIGGKRAILLYDLLFPAAYLLILTGNRYIVLLAAFLLAGLARGACSNCCNATVNALYPGNVAALNSLHAAFSAGSFLFPLFLTAFTHFSSKNWIYACILMAAFGCLSISLFAIFFSDFTKTEKDEKKRARVKEYGFFSEKLFRAITTALFFYLCAETGVIGWMVTYFTDTGYISEELSQITASILWIMVLLGRISTAHLSKRFDKRKLMPFMGLGFALFFMILLFVRSAAGIVITVMCIGFFLAGIFPTAISFSATLSERYPLSLSYILTIAGFGSVIMPSVMGFIAEQAGISWGIGTVTLAVLIDLGCIIRLCTLKEY